MSDPTQDQQLQAILSQISKFGFEFYAYDENKIPLVKGPNNQVVNINVAIQFVNQKIKETQNSSGSVENPNVENLDIKASPERAAETKVETSIEQAAESNTEIQTQDANTQIKAPKTSPRMKLKQPEIKPYGDGFDPKSFDSTNIQSTLNFIESNSSSKSTSSNKWLAEQFKKFVKEFQVNQEKK